MLTNRSRTSLALVSTLALGAALAAAPSASRAQSFNGTPTVVSGSAGIVTGVGSTTVTLGAAQTVINWVPTDTATGGGTIAFQAAGTTATFQNNGLISDFAVLNRIVPVDVTRAVKFDGAVKSQIGNASSGFLPGGTVFFYSPAGIVVGSNARFDVGHLGLTTADPFRDANGSFFFGNTVFFSTASPGSSVTIQPGAIIDGSKANGSYMAAFAPVVNNGGTITQNGSAALVSADAGYISFAPSGLFTIQINTGTSGSGTTLTNSGTIGGVAGSGLANSHRVYLVAVPRNDAITLALTAGSKIGFDVAGAADVDGNAVVITTGYSVSQGYANLNQSPPPSVPAGNITIAEGTYTSYVLAAAQGDASLTASSGTAAFATDLALLGTTGAHVTANPGGTVTIGGVLEVSADNQKFNTDAPALGGTSTIVANGGTIRVNGNLFNTAAGIGANSVANEGPSIPGGNGTGGSASIALINGGKLIVRGATTISADGIGGESFYADAAAGTGQGGNAVLTVNGPGSVGTFTGGLTVSSNGQGGSGGNCAVCTPESGTGKGGTAAISGSGSGSGVVAGSLLISSDGFGGSGIAQPGSDGTGGNSSLTLGTGMTISVTGNVRVSAEGNGGGQDNGTAGRGIGGTASFTAPGAGPGPVIGAALTVSANAFGGSATGTGGVGGDALGGTATLSAGGRNLSFTNPVQIFADASGGTGFFDVGGAGGAGTGGTAAVLADGANLALPGKSSISAGGNGGDAFAPGTGVGGTASLVAHLGALTGPDLQLYAGGNGGFGANGSNGGNGRGGSVLVNALSDAAGGSTIAITNLLLSAPGIGGDGGDGVNAGDITPETPGGFGGTGTGGTISALAGPANGTLTTASFAANAGGTGGHAGAGGAGFGTGARGGDGGIGIGGRVVAGSGGDNLALPQVGFANLGVASLDASGLGGAGGDSIVDSPRGIGGDGGAGQSGSATLLAAGGAVRFSSAQVRANATGGAGGFGLTNGAGGAAMLVAGSGFALDVRGPAALPNRGQVDGTNLVLRSVTTAGTGIKPGATSGVNSNVISIVGGDVRVSSLDAGVVGGAPGAPVGSDSISLTNGTLAVSGALTFATTNTLSVALDSSTINAATTTLSASDFVFLLPRVASKGTLTTGTLALATARNAYLDGNVASTGPVSIVAPGSIDVGSIVAPAAIALTATTGSIRTGAVQGDALSAAAATSLTTGTITTAQSVALTAGGTALTGAIVAGDRVTASAGGNLTTGAVSAGRSAPSAAPGATYAVSLTSGGALVAGDLAGNAIKTQSGGATTVGNVDARGNFSGTAGTGFTSQAITATGTLGVQAIQGIVTGALSGAQSVVLSAGTTLSAGAIASQQKVALTAGGAATTGAITAGDSVTADVTGNLTTGAVSAGRVSPSAAAGASYAVSLTSRGALLSGDIAGNAVTTKSTLATTLGNVDARGSFGGTAGTGFTSQAITATGTLAVQAIQGIVTGALSGTQGVTLGAGTTLTSGSVSSGQKIAITAGGAVATGALTAGDSVTADSGGDLTTAAISAGRTAPSAAPGATYAVALTSGGSVQTGTIAGANVAVRSVGATTLGAVDARGNFSATAGSDFSGQAIAATGTLVVQAARSISAGALAGTQGVRLTAGTTLGVGTVVTAQKLDISAGGAATTAALTAGDSVTVNTGGNLAVGSVSAGRVTPSAALGATYAVSLISGGALSSGDIAGANVTTQSSGTTGIGAVDARGNFGATATGGFASQAIAAAGTLTIQTAQALTSEALAGTQGVNLAAGTTLGTGPISSAQKIALVSGAAATTGALTAGDSISANAGGNLTMGSASAGRIAPSAAPGASFAVALTSGGALQAGDIAGAAVAVQATGAATFGNVDARGAARLAAGTNLTGQTVSATGALLATAGQALALGNIGAADVRVVAGTDMAIGAVTSAQTALLIAGGNIAGGAISGRDVIALAGGSIASGALNATGTGSSGQVYLAGAGTIPSTSSPLTVTAATILGSAPVRSGGAIGAGGPVTARALTAATQSGFSAPAMTVATAIVIDAGGTAAVQGRWSSPLITVSSNDIDIAASGRLDAGLGTIQLNSLNPAQALVGDGLTGTGYALSNAEFARINSGNFTFVARDNTGAVDLAIGTLNVTGPDAGSTIDLPNGSVVFATGSASAPSGGTLVSGQVTAVGFRDTNTLLFGTGRLQIDNAAGGIAVSGRGGALSGQVVVNAARFEAASAALLARLAADPNYAGRFRDLNTPTGTVRAGGVISGGSLNFAGAKAVLIQNTGTYADPTGFFTRLTALSAGSAAAPIELVVNGQLLNGSATVTGTKVHTAIRALGIGGYKAGSTVNGCLVSLPLCGFPGYFPIPALADEFGLVTLDQLSEEPFTDESEQRNERVGSGGLGPIAPPEPLIDTRPLDPPADIDDPVTGSGIPEPGGRKADPKNGSK